MKKSKLKHGWELWFAWYPVRDTNGDLVWLRTVWRRRCWNGIVGSQNSRFWWEYERCV